MWTVPLIGSLGTPINGYAVHVDPVKCLIGDEEGKGKQKHLSLLMNKHVKCVYILCLLLLNSTYHCMEQFYLLVVEFNESVVPTKLYEVPLGIKCIVQDGEFTYIGCDDGGLYGKHYL